jgi:hypothetical protein
MQISASGGELIKGLIKVETESEDLVADRNQGTTDALMM